MNVTNSTQNRAAQLAYLAEDKELLEMIWQVSALTPEARRILSLMINHLASLEKARQAA